LFSDIYGKILNLIGIKITCIISLYIYIYIYDKTIVTRLRIATF